MDTSKAVPDFGSMALDYAQYRPVYPQALVKRLSRLVPYRGVVWDCACGSGQMSVPLAQEFQLVCATDHDPAQVDAAPAHNGVLYSVQPARQTDFPDVFFDMVVVAQALHWFADDAFYREVHRTLTTGGVLAAVGYGLLHTDGPVGQLLQNFYWDEVWAYWPQERRFLEDRYQSLPFPYTPLPFPDMEMLQSWTQAQLLGYLHTWSAVQHKLQRVGPLFWQQFCTQVQSAWGSAATLTFSFPLFVKAGRKP